MNFVVCCKLKCFSSIYEIHYNLGLLINSFESTKLKTLGVILCYTNIFYQSYIFLHDNMQYQINLCVVVVNGHRKQLRIQSTNKTVFFV